MTLTDLPAGFRDIEQLGYVRRVIHDRLADDRDQQACRYLMRFWWQLGMTYQEVTLDQLRANLGGAELRLVEELIDAVRTSPEAIDDWVDAVEGALPVVQDRGFAQVQTLPGGRARPTP
ncbi:hypothetical protein ABT116_31960 [Streptomyces sp. NPDC002130]|uniref:hypothetical protein n=1 Tax=Streptomyces sp. NPDC002130 TaxID=3155568 RepID=UPI0033199BE8